MMSLRSRLTLIVVLGFALLLGTMFTAEKIRERLFEDYLRDASIAAQQALWEEIISVEVLSVKSSLSLLSANGHMTAEGLSILKMDPTWYMAASLEAVALVDENRRVFVSQGQITPRQLLDAGTMDLVRKGEEASGLRQIGNHQIVLIVAEPVIMDDQHYTLVAAAQLNDALSRYAARTLSSAHILSLHGKLLSSSDPERWNTYQPDVSTRLPTRQEIDTDQRTYVATTVPLKDIVQSSTGVLVSMADVTDAQASRNALRNSTLIVTAILGLLGLLVINVVIWRSFRPLRTALDVLNDLSLRDGDTGTQSTVKASDEIGHLSQAIGALRHRTALVDEHNMQRKRMRLKQERVIQHELKALAAAVDSTSREEVLSLLNEKADPSQPEEPLLRLTRVLSNLRHRLIEQHMRLSRMVVDLRDALISKSKLLGLQQELKIASTVQMSILPRMTIQDQRVALSARIIPAQEVGGDFYDYAILDKHHLSFVIADVSGKGIPAALFMAISRTLLKSISMFVATPRSCVQRLNDLLAAENDQMLFVTLFYGILDLRTGALQFVNAGHHHPYLLRHSGTLEQVPGINGPAVGVMQGIGYAQGQLVLEPGDTLYLYTDGITEAFDPNQNLYGNRRLEATLSAMPANAFPDTISDRIIQDMRAFEQGFRQTDDITSLCLRYLGNADTHDRTKALR